VIQKGSRWEEVYTQAPGVRLAFGVPFERSKRRRNSLLFEGEGAQNSRSLMKEEVEYAQIRLSGNVLCSAGTGVQGFRTEQTEVAFLR
jgi:hypothetical protein